jgi:hypothetical protein
MAVRATLILQWQCQDERGWLGPYHWSCGPASSVWAGASDTLTLHSVSMRNWLRPQRSYPG